MHIDDLTLEIEICAFCPLMCKDMCCFHQHAKTEESAPHIRNLSLWKVLEGKDSSEKDDFLKEAAEIIYQCTLCGQCTAWCGRSRDIPNNMMAGRADLLELGFAPKKVIEIDEKTEEEHNPYGEHHEKILSKLDKNTQRTLMEQKDTRIGLWIGCTAAYYQPEMVQAIVKILNTADIDFQILAEEEWCCGLPQYKLGLRGRAGELAKHNAQALDKKGFDILIVDCPECYRAFTEFYPAWGYPLKTKISHSTEYIIDLINNGLLQLKRKIPKNLTYHDPCELARHSTPTVRTNYKTSDIHDPPRELLRKIPGINLKEMRWNRYKTYCCGGGIGVRENYPEVSFEIGQRVPNEALKVGADTLAVACPACKRQFSRILGKGGDLEIYSIAELVAQSL